MTTVECIIDLCCRVDTEMHDVPKHPHATLYPSELVTLAVVCARNGVGPRPFDRWLTRDYRALFPKLPERTRLFRLFATHRAWADYFLANPTTLGVADSYGIELIHCGKAAVRVRSGAKGNRTSAGLWASSWPTL